MNMDLSALNLPANPVVIDCGCNEGQWLSHVKPQLKGRPKIVAIDMLYEEAKCCQLNHSDVLVVNTALSDCYEPLVARRHKCSQSSSILKMTELHNKVWGSPTHKPVNTERVYTTPLDRLMERLMIEHVDLLKLDLQGYELKALKGASYILTQTDHVISEVSWAELYEEQVLFPELDEFMQKAGFVWRQFYDPRYLPAEIDGFIWKRGQMVCGDAWWSRK